ncbi:MAG: alpha/beta hydrolase [Hyphomonadaceae bacterium]
MQFSRRRAVLAAAAAVSAGFPSVAHAARYPARTVRYAASPGVDANLQSLDLYGERPGARRPILAFVHGGGWTMGDKANDAAGEAKAACFVPRGFVYASLNYRLSPAAHHPDHIEDVAAGLAWLAANAASFGGDPRRLYVMGHSSGAHLAALAATDERHLAAHGARLSDLRGVIALDGEGYNVRRAAAAAEKRGGPLGRWYEDAFGCDPATWWDASPLAHVAPGKGVPPFLIFYTAAPRAGAQANELAAALNRAGAVARVEFAAGKTHAGLNREIGRKGDTVTARIFAMLEAWGA